MLVPDLSFGEFEIDGQLHPHSFLRDGDETRRVETTVSCSGQVSIESRLKSTGSAFTNFHRYEYTTLQDVYLLHHAKWTYSPEKSKIQEIPFDDVANSVREITLSTFATDNSASVQATVDQMGEVVNLKPFNLLNEAKDMNIFQPISDPSYLGLE
ncbi:hypothetical protein K493DRAFT_349628 [Basidiobolus meristosporus CBS 931.73]|uniref:factor independent urate hydroxylase n=1 Tax=Basidiobolus meristosporus CBS 931.73 TaxID=1314790 RepID=A0A1Y1YKE2_9FUNG|nr:hypothetical protein K493DRAFT_349628 [Basidiobolus meristosporus CBS 931.73]|eukprot:ORX98064.1 hypothetical protein K493DRAFT_349628 [Basidiobolus meristosporus CBS 931.73]